eukprot:TRINITY_DN3034_c1_g2_i1.p1 TRINITY_DN3034_c1_g2~~TRINITY_DN3034_c1_g2_i1.p1  ORF type:complete len:338 (-),score=45.40 TRINITY_DN3034_c1_g2_i1:637-1560(-)
MDRLEEAQETLNVSSCGRQAEGTKRSNPSWTLPKAGRDDVKKVFISKKHPQDLLGRGSPGHVYQPKRQRELPKWGFGTAEARPHLAPNKYPEQSNDLVCALPDSGKFKYPSRTAAIGTCPRDVISNAPDLEGFPKGVCSPGPQRYRIDKCPPAFRLAHAPEADKIPPSWTMRPKTEIIEHKSQTGPKVGPGTYPNPAACGAQASSEKPSKPIWSCCKTDRFPKKIQKNDSGRLWDGEGKKKIQFSRSFSTPSSFSFGTSTRFHAQKVAPALTPLDRGPAGLMGHPRKDHPSIPPRKEILKYTDVPSG